MFIPDGIDQFVYDIGLILSITFVVPLAGAIGGTIAASVGALHAGMKEAGRQDG
jgi:hypothetical protein